MKIEAKVNNLSLNEKKEQKNLYQKRNEINKLKNKREEEAKIKRRGNVILFILISLTLIGFLNFYSIISRYSMDMLMRKLMKYFVIVGISTVLFFLIQLKVFNLKKLFCSMKGRAVLIGITLISLLIVSLNLPIFPTINGGKGWIRFSGFSFQITELTKLSFIIIVSSFFSKGRHNDLESNFSQNIKSVSVITVLLLLIISILLKDLGTAIHYILILGFMIFLSDIKDKFLYGLMLIGTFIITLISSYLYFFAGNSYKQQRLKHFIDGLVLNKYSKEDAYQIYQSLIAFGTGGFLGKGYGNGVQKYNYIPEVETDFAISTFGEELGLLGMLTLLSTFLLLFYIIISIADEEKDYFYKYLVGGIAGYFITQVLINIGVAIGLIPVLGIPLPLISSGGSSFITFVIAFALVYKINRNSLVEENK